MISIRQLVKRRRSRRQIGHTGPRRVGRWLAHIALIVAALIFAVGLTGFGAVVSAFAVYSEHLPEPGALSGAPSEGSPTRLYDRSGQQLLYEIGGSSQGGRTWVSLSNIPLALRHATLALDDPTFYQDSVDNVRDFVRTGWNAFSDYRATPFGLSITQRLVSNLMAEHAARGLESRLRELVWTTRIDQTYSKDKILEWYLNTNSYGIGVYGVGDASQVYFAKPTNELSLGEAALLAGLSSSPGLNPWDDLPAATERQVFVLQAMVDHHNITNDEAAAAAAAPLNIQVPEHQFDLVAPHFAIAARNQLEVLFGRDRVYQGGLVVYTTLDYPLFLQAQCAARTQIARLSGQSGNVVVPPDDGSACTTAKYLSPLSDQAVNADHNVSNAAVTVIDAKTGEILAMVGSLDYYNTAIVGSTNAATLGRQPGAALQPFAYLTAFQQGYTPATMMLDVPTSFDLGGDQPFVPVNGDNRYHGPMSIRMALANEVNVPAVQIINWTGTDNVLHTAHAMGVNTLRPGLTPYNPTLAVSGGDVTLTDLTYAYSVFASGGVMHGTPASSDSALAGYRRLDPTFILRVEDQAGNILWEYGKGDTFASSTVLEPGLSYLITDILSDNEARSPSVGGNGPFKLDRPAAVMTGTSADSQDTWAIGYTPQLAVGVWVGNSDRSRLVDLPADAAAVPVWQAIMRYAHQSMPVEEWERPQDIVEMTVCDPSGLLPTPNCPVRQEIFKRGTEPTVPDNMFQSFGINTETGRLATVYTPPNLIEQRVFQVMPPEALDWAHEAGVPQPPSEYDNIEVQPASGEVSILEPAPFSYVRGIVQVKGNARDPNLRVYRLDYGLGLNPVQWFQIGSDSSIPTTKGLLGEWDTTGLDGLYSLRLTLIRGDSTFQQSILQLTVDNVPPDIRVALPHDGQEFAQSQGYVSFQAIVEDNIAVDRVEFYIDDVLSVTATSAPFAGRWKMTSTGIHTIKARAYDSAGNMTASQNISVVVNP